MSLEQFTPASSLRRPRKLALRPEVAQAFDSLLLVHEHDLIDLRFAVQRAHDTNDYSAVRTMLGTTIESLQAAQNLFQHTEPAVDA